LFFHNTRLTLSLTSPNSSPVRKKQRPQISHSVLSFLHFIPNHFAGASSLLFLLITALTTQKQPKKSNQNVLPTTDSVPPPFPPNHPNPNERPDSGPCSTSHSHWLRPLQRVSSLLHLYITPFLCQPNVLPVPSRLNLVHQQHFYQSSRR